MLHWWCLVGLQVPAEQGWALEDGWPEMVLGWVNSWIAEIDVLQDGPQEEC